MKKRMVVIVSFIVPAILLLVMMTGCNTPQDGQSRLSPDVSSSVPVTTDTGSLPPYSAETSAPAGEANNVPLTEDDILRLQAQAEVLTEHIVTKALEYNERQESSPVSDSEIRNFILGLSFYMENTAHPYYNMISQTPEHLYIFPLKNVQRMAYELFSRENWDFGSTMEGVSFDFNAEKQQYESGLEFGLGGGRFDCKEMKAGILPDGQTIKVDFMLYSYLEDEDDPTWGEAERYSMYFTIIQESDALFLRYSTLQPA